MWAMVFCALVHPAQLLPWHSAPLLHEVEPEDDVFPISHVKHMVDAVAGWNLPGWQSTQARASSLAENFPGSQAAHPPPVRGDFPAAHDVAAFPHVAVD